MKLLGRHSSVKRALQRHPSESLSVKTWRLHPYHIMLATASAAVVLFALLVYVMVKRRRKAAAPLSPETPKQPYCPPRIPADLSHAHPQPSQPQPEFPRAVRIKTRGLLERRGSSASLTIDLKPDPDFAFSYGSPPKECSAVEYLSSAGNRMTRRQLRSCLKNPKVLHQEFLEIPLNHPTKVDQEGSYGKNRYKSIFPNEDTRVELVSDHQPQPSCSYINANFVRGYDGEEEAFVATQGPLETTINDFWAMVWQQRASCIVMLTKLKEKNKSKCEPYLPARDGQYGPVNVSVRMTLPKNGYYARDLVLKSGDEEHTMKHYWFTSWPDQKAPFSAARSLLELAHDVEMQRIRHRQRCGASPSGPVVVHCSAGLGRTGCFVGVSIGMRQLAEENMTDVLGVVCQMRLDRGGMVQTPEQYELVHRALALYERQLPETPTSAALPLTSSSSNASSQTTSPST